MPGSGPAQNNSGGGARYRMLVPHGSKDCRINLPITNAGGGERIDEGADGGLIENRGKKFEQRRRGAGRLAEGHHPGGGTDQVDIGDRGNAVEHFGGPTPYFSIGRTEGLPQQRTGGRADGLQRCGSLFATSVRVAVVAVIGFGENDAVSPAGRPEAARET